MQVGHLRKLLGCQTTVEGIETLDTVILHLQVSLHEVDVRSQVVEEWSGVSSAQHRDAYVRILLSHCPYHRYGHSHITQR